MPGETVTVTFRVTDESREASTTGVAIRMPTDTPLTVIRFQQVPGWTADLQRRALPAPVTQGTVALTESVTSVEFTADADGGIPPGGFVDFGLTIGPIPDVDRLGFPTVQTYNDGTTTRWDQPVAAGGEDPERSMPTLTVGATTVPATKGVGVSADAAGESTADTVDATARIFGVMGIVAAIAAGLASAIGLRRKSMIDTAAAPASVAPPARTPATPAPRPSKKRKR